MRLNNILLVVILAFTLNAWSQSVKLDSIKNLIDNSESDTAKLNLRMVYAGELLYIDPGRASNLLDKIILESQTLKYKKVEAEALYHKAVALAFVGKYDISLDVMIQSSDIYRELSLNDGVAMCMGGMGNLYYFMNNFTKAIEYYTGAYNIYLKLDNITGMASCLNNLGLIYQENNDYKMALEYQLKGLDLEKRVGNTRGVAISNISIASLLLDMNRVKEAKQYAFKSIQYSKELSDSTSIADGYLRIAECFRVENVFDSAQYYLNQSIRINSKLKAYHQLAYALDIQTMLYDSAGNYQKALESNRELMRVKDSLLNGEKTSQIIEMQTKFDTERKDRENELLTEQNHNQKLTLYSLAIFIVLIMALAMNIYFSRKKIRSSNQNLVLLNGELQQQKEEILTQTDNLQQANDAIKQQKDLLVVSHRKITDSIAYASIIQSAMLPADHLIQGFFTDFFVYYLPRDVVSGDFYWYKEKNGSLIFAVADCTGHGVPGSLLSIMGISFLNEIIGALNITQPNLILEQLRKSVKSIFSQSPTDLRKEGVEIAICNYNPKTRMLSYSGAKLSLWIIRNGIIQEYAADKMPIGLTMKESPFSLIEVKLEKDDIFYMFTDGISDQLGAKTGKKYLRKNFIEFLSQISCQTLINQKNSINNMFLDWKGNQLDQTDDILVLGIKV